MAKQSFKTAVGAFVIGGLALLVAGIILLGGGRMFSDDIEYVLYFDGSVSGLNIGAPVVFRGVPMGQVTRISLEANPRDASVTIPVYIRLDENSIVRAGVTGELTDNFRQEILRRYYTAQVSFVRGEADECQLRKLELVMQQAGVTPDICPAVAASLQKAEETGKPAGAMVLPDGRVVTGKTSSLLGASASLLLNALKAQGGVSDKLDLISAQVIEPISKLKIESLGHHNPRLHSDEVLIALCISALTNPIAQLAQEQLGSLRGCDAHFSVIISEEDIKLYKRLGIHVTCEPRYEVKKLYHK